MEFYYKKIDIVVANAGGLTTLIPALEIIEEIFDRTFLINTKGVFSVIQETVKHIDDNGKIIYVSSSTTLTTMEGKVVYGISKLALEYMRD